MSDKLICSDRRCGWRGLEPEILKAQHPFITGDEILGCPECREVDCLVVACDEPECWDIASCGIPTPERYRRVCGKHYDEIESALAKE